VVWGLGGKHDQRKRKVKREGHGGADLSHYKRKCKPCGGRDIIQLYNPRLRPQKAIKNIRAAEERGSSIRSRSREETAVPICPEGSADVGRRVMITKTALKHG